MHDKTLFDELERNTDTAFADFVKPYFIPSFGLICKDTERLVHSSIVQEVPYLDYLDHDVKTSKT